MLSRHAHVFGLPGQEWRLPRSADGRGRPLPSRGRSLLGVAAQVSPGSRSHSPRTGIVPRESGKMSPKTGKKFPGGNDRNGSGGTYAEIVADALVAELGATHRAAKILMGWTGAGERTVKHWLAGTHGPAGGYLIVLMRELRVVFRTVVEADGRAVWGRPHVVRRRRTGRAIPRVCRGWSRRPDRRSNTVPPARVRMTVIVIVFMTVMMAGIMPARRCLSGGSGAQRQA